MGIGSVAVYSDADRSTLHVHMADEAIAIGPAPAAEAICGWSASSMPAKRALMVCTLAMAYPNESLVSACEEMGVFHRAPANAIRKMGSKQARAAMEAAGVPVDTVGSLATWMRRGEKLILGYPVMIKAAMGGSGKACALCTAPMNSSAVTGRKRGACILW